MRYRAHHRRVAPGTTGEHLYLAHKIGLMLSGQSRKLAIALSLGTVASGTGWDTLVRQALFK